jgi:hypothetical protein
LFLFVKIFLKGVKVLSEFVLAAEFVNRDNGSDGEDKDCVIPVKTPVGNHIFMFLHLVTIRKEWHIDIIQSHLLHHNKNPLIFNIRALFRG